MMRVLICFGLCALTVTCHAVDIVLVRGGSVYDAIAEGFLSKSGVEYDGISEDQLVEQGLTGYRLAIFPHNPGCRNPHFAQVATFLEGGGKLLWQSSVPEPLKAALGIAGAETKTPSYPGEFASMRFTEDRPPGFPAEVKQESPNIRVVSGLQGAGRVIADWHDSQGKNLGIPAVIITPDTVWTGHVFWSGADVEQQRQLLLAAIGYLMPDALGSVVQGAVAQAISLTGYTTWDELVAATAVKATARPLAERAREAAREALAAATGDTPAVGLALAEEARANGQLAATALFPSRPYELRGAWMHPDEAFDYEAAMDELKAANFNAVFPIVCGPNYAKYPSAYAPQLSDRDHVADCLAAAHARGIEVHCWKANWQASRGRNDELRQQFIDEGRMVMSIDQARGGEEKGPYPWRELWLDPSDDRNRELEFDMMMELVENYEVDGIHFDFMRYPSEAYCYCERCHGKFQEWAGVTVANWPDDCYGQGVLAERYRDWRRMLQTTLVARIAEGARQRRPGIKLSLAARASMSGSYGGDAQDWVTWAAEHYLDLLCPMDYTNSVQVLHDKLKPQVEAVDGVIPVYAGLGVSPTRSDSPVNLSQQIVMARELGADGFLLFALSPFARSMLPALALGPTSTPVTVMPHHEQSAQASFTYPAPVNDTAVRTYPPGAELPVTVSVRATGENVEQLTVQALLMAAAGGPTTALTQYQSTDKRSHELNLTMRPEPGAWSVILQGEVVFKDGREQPFYLRSLPLRVLTQQQLEDTLALVNPPAFRTADLHVGVVLEGYGSQGILWALRGTEGIEARPLGALTTEFLAPCDVVVLTQPNQDPRRITPKVLDAFRGFIESGGGVIAVRDVLGNWIYQPIYADIAKGTGAQVKSQRVKVVLDHPLTAGMTVGQVFSHAYSDHVGLIAGERATVVIKDLEDNPVVVCAEVGEGRYVACGIPIGRSTSGPDIEPQGIERTLLINAVRWLGQ